MIAPTNKLPWTLSTTTGRRACIQSATKLTETVFETVAEDIPHEHTLDRRDAAYIVKAANAFPEMVALLKDAVEKLTQGEAWQQSDAAIAIDFYLKKLEE